MSILDIFKNRGRSMESIAYNNQSNMINMFYNRKTELAYLLYNMEPMEGNRLQIPKSIVSTIVNSASQEFDFKVISENKNLLDINKYLMSNVKNIEGHLCVGGNVCLKPYIKNNRLGVAVYGARDFVPFYNEYGELDTVYFKSDIRISELVSFTLVEKHTYNPETREYRIDNQLYTGANSDYNRKTGRLSATLGVRVPLSKCDATAYLDDFYVIEDVDRHLCSVISLDNSLTYSKGFSIYDSSIGLIKDAEELYASVKWEYKGGELALDVPSDLLRKSGKGQAQFEMPEGKERLYRKMPGASSDMGISTFAPTLRDASYWSGLNEILRKIEMNTNLYYGALSNVNDTQKTAAEVISSKQRFYVLVNGIKEKLRVGIDDAINNSCVLCNRLVPEFMSENVSIEFNIGDSVLDIVSQNKEISI